MKLTALIISLLAAAAVSGAERFTSWGVTYEIQPNRYCVWIAGTTPEAGFSIDIYDTVKDSDGEAYSITGILPGAFADCTAEYINIYSSLYTSVAPGTFADMKHVTHVSLSDNIRSIGNGAFARSAALKEITGGSYSKVPEKMCEKCTSLTYISFPKEVTSIGDWAFSHCEKLEFVMLPENVTRIGDCAFEYYSSLEEVATGDKIKYVGEYAFAICPRLKKITFPEGVTFGHDWFIKEFK